MHHRKPALYGAIAVVGIGLVLVGVSSATVLTLALVAFMVTMHIGGHGGHGRGHGAESGVDRPDADLSTSESHSHLADQRRSGGPADSGASRTGAA